ncbi:hypothetical protein DMH12_24795 [Streptomyces sp. WAC 04229]|uniref:hypothetical protein n=1 Tax=Streptomyces sp. WAC 04229 TaxID=2203206 RepID=UPI000F74A1EC|nr:hypothetical protein [Streptomyces sp. WAC 04229]RSN50505.1 hypothetical protein DMH12_24795 [Streptomyces sp. WAC 04229]
MFNHDAGHSHGSTLGFVAGCPLCDAAKTARNQAIAHIAEAIHLLSLINPTGARPTLRLNLAPIDLTGDDTGNCHSIDLTSKQAETVADAVDSVNAHAGSEPPDDAPIDGLLAEAVDAVTRAIPIDEDSLKRRKAKFEAWMEGQAGEAIESGEWSAAAVAHKNPQLYADVTDLFLLLDPREITRTVLDHRQVDMLYAVQALDDMYGDVHDPYADEDGDL